MTAAELKALRTTVVYKTVGERVLTADIYPPTGGEKPGPALVWFHGGGWSGGNKDEPMAMPSLISRLLRLGLTLISVEYRLTREPGVFFPACADDCCDALRFFYRRADEFSLDRSRFLCAGASAGGHLTLLAAFACENFGDDAEKATVPLRCIVDLCGPVDLASTKRTSDQAESDRILSRFFGPDTASHARRLREASPVTYIAAAPRERLLPVVAIHGELDELVHNTQPLLIKEIYDRAGADFELTVVRNALHDFTQAPGAAPVSHTYAQLEDIIFTFIRKNLWNITE